MENKELIKDKCLIVNFNNIIDLAAEKKKKISKAYYENEAERTLYIQQKLVEETEEIVSDSPRVDEENEVASCCDPLDFLTNFQASVHQPFPLKDFNSTNILTNDNSFVGFPCVDIKDGENSICNEIDLNYLPRSAYLDVPGSAYPYREWSTGVSNSVQVNALFRFIIWIIREKCLFRDLIFFTSY